MEQQIHAHGTQRMRCRLIISPGNGIARFYLRFGGREVESDDSGYPSDDCLTIRARRLGRQIGRLPGLAGRLSDDCSSVDCSAGSEDYRKIQLRAISVSDILSTPVVFLSDSRHEFIIIPGFGLELAAVSGRRRGGTA